jgi:quinol monooxygenase YgiN
MNPVIVINRFTIRPGRIDDFVDAQHAFASALPRCGLVGGRMYRGLDGQSATLVSMFESKNALDELRQRADFKAHLERISQFVESSSPILYEQAYTTGDFR